jgi:hypothetical protein
MNIGGFKRFNWLPMQPVWKDMEIRRARRAEFAKQDQANLDAMNMAMSDALQNHITGSAKVYATAALKRVQAAAKAKTDETLKQIDDAQKLIDKTAASTKSTSAPKSPSTVLDTTA